MNANYDLRKEIAFLIYLSAVVSSVQSRNDRGRRALVQMQRKIETIQRSHEEGRRVYYRRLAILLASLCEQLGYQRSKDGKLKRAQMKKGDVRFLDGFLALDIDDQKSYVAQIGGLVMAGRVDELPFGNVAT